MQNAASFLTTLNALVLDEMLQILPFADIVGLALTSTEFLERITGRGNPPRTFEEHAIHRSGRAYAWPGILDRITRDFGMHTDVDKCTHPNPALRKKVAESMRRLLSNKTDHPDTSLHNRLNNVVRLNSDTEIQFPRTEETQTFSSDRYLNWRRTFVLFLLYTQLHESSQKQDPDNDYFTDKKSISDGHYPLDNVKHGVVVASIDGLLYVVSVADYVPRSLPLEIPIRVFGTEIRVSRDSNDIYLFKKPLYGAVQTKYMGPGYTYTVYYISPQSDGNSVVTKSFPKLDGDMTISYFEKNGVTDLCVVNFINDSVIVWFTTNDPIVITLDTRFEINSLGSVDNVAKQKLVGLAQNVSDKYGKLNANPYLFVAFAKSLRGTVERHAYFSPIDDLNDTRILNREQLLFKRIIGDETSRMELGVWKSTGINSFSWPSRVKNILFTEIDKTQTFFVVTTYLPLRERYSPASNNESDAITNNLVITVAKFNKINLLKRVTFVIAHRNESEDRFFELENATWREMQRNNNLIKLTALNESTSPFGLPSRVTFVIDASDNRITFYERFNYKPSMTNNMLDSLTYSIDTYESPDSDEPQQTIIQ